MGDLDAKFGAKIWLNLKSKRFCMKIWKNLKIKKFVMLNKGFLFCKSSNLYNYEHFCYAKFRGNPLKNYKSTKFIITRINLHSNRTCRAGSATACACGIALHGICWIYA